MDQRLHSFSLKIVDATTGEFPADPGLWPDPVSKGTSARGASFAGGVMPIQLNARRPWEEDELWVAPVEAPDLGPFTISLHLQGYEHLDGEVRAARWRESEPAPPTLLRLQRREDWTPPGRLRLLFRQPDGSPVAEQPFLGQPLVATLRAVDGPREGLQFRFQPGPRGEMAFDRVPARRYFLVTRLGLVSSELQPQPFDVLGGQESVVTIPFPAVGCATFELDTSTAVPAFVQVSLDRIPPLRRPLRLYDVHFQERKTTIPYLPAGRYRIRFMALDFASDDIEFEIVPPHETKVVVADGDAR